MCRVLRVARSGFYAWLREPESARSIEDRRLVGRIRYFHAASGGVYGSPRIYRDLKEDGERVAEKRVARLMREEKIRAIRGYKAPRHHVAGPTAAAADNLLDRKFTVDAPDQVWVSDITYIRTWEGWLYLAIIVDLYSRMVVGWSMGSRAKRGIVLDALLAAIMRRQPEPGVIIHSDQGSQYTSDDWKRFCEANGLVPSMSRRGNCWDNAVAESFFSSLKKERIRKQIYRTRDLAKADVFDYIEGFYNRRRRHSHLGDVSPEAFERAS